MTDAGAGAGAGAHLEAGVVFALRTGSFVFDIDRINLRGIN